MTEKEFTPSMKAVGEIYARACASGSYEAESTYYEEFVRMVAAQREDAYRQGQSDCWDKHIGFRDGVENPYRKKAEPVRTGADEFNEFPVGQVFYPPRRGDNKFIKTGETSAVRINLNSGEVTVFEDLRDKNHFISLMTWKAPVWGTEA